MRISKNRRDRKLLGFYRAVYGIRPPFTVVVDGTALQTSVNLQLDLKTELPKLLGGNVRLFVTPAVVAELRALGKEVKVATSMAKRLPKLRVGTSQAGAARDSVGRPPDTSRRASTTKCAPNRSDRPSCCQGRRAYFRAD